MKILEKIINKNVNFWANPSITIAFLGDSVTHGCFDCYFDNNGRIQTIFDPSKAYPQRVKEILNQLYPSVQINIINSGISGDNARNGNERFDRDIAKFSPDLVVVSYGLNDCMGGKKNVETYVSSLKSIFSKVKDLGAECIFLTENMMCTYPSPHLKELREKSLAETISAYQNDGTLDYFFDSAKAAAKECEIRICDMYSIWKTLYESKVDTTDLLANYYNHPIPLFHKYTAIKLVEEMFK